jgi:iron-sulfur cluster repair protein YtfE (RIC family)
MNLLDHESKDRIVRNVEKQSEQEFSPMDPPDAYAPPAMDPVPYADLHPFLQALYDEHRGLEQQLEAFEEMLNALHEQGANKELNAALGEMFSTLDTRVSAHSQKEDRQLFPALQPVLLAHGEHSQGTEKTTAIDALEDEHHRIVQLLAVTFNVFKLAARLPDVRSQIVALDVAIHQGKDLIETLRLHMFREENILFPLAHKYREQWTL